LKNDYEIVANLENKGTDNEAYYKVDYTLLVSDRNIVESLTELVQNTQKTIKLQSELIRELQDRLKLKFEAEEENISEPLTNIIHNIVDEVKNQKHKDISNIILKKLIQ
ncbi:10636_t:CDS:2, partial [Dentiscutata erythropus]